MQRMHGRPIAGKILRQSNSPGPQIRNPGSRSGIWPDPGPVGGLEALLHQEAISEYTGCAVIDMLNRGPGHITAKYP